MACGSLKTTLGAMKRLEFTGISSEDYQKIQTDFADTERISAVWPREFDSQDISILDVETRLDNMGLGQEVTKATSGRAKLDRSTADFSSITPCGLTGVEMTSLERESDTPTGDKPWWQVW